MFYPAYRDRLPRSWVIPAMTGVTVTCAAWLGGHYHEFVPGLALFVTVAGYALVAAMMAHLRARLSNPRLAVRVVVGCLAVALVSPAAWAVSALDARYAGPASTPAAGWVGHRFRVGAIRASGTGHLPHVVFDQPTGFTERILAFLTRQHRGETYLVATEQARLAEPLLRGANVEVLPIGGFSGQVPFPSASQLSALIAAGKLRYVLLSAATTVAAPHPGASPLAWVRQRCQVVPRAAYGGRPKEPYLYDCGAAARSTR